MSKSKAGAVCQMADTQGYKIIKEYIDNRIEDLIKDLINNPTLAKDGDKERGAVKELKELINTINEYREVFKEKEE